MDFKIEQITIPKYSSDNFIIIYSAVDGKRRVYHSDGKPARVTESNSDQLKEIYELMKMARKHRKHSLYNTIHNDDNHN